MKVENFWSGDRSVATCMSGWFVLDFEQSMYTSDSSASIDVLLLIHFHPSVKQHTRVYRPNLKCWRNKQSKTAKNTIVCVPSVRNFRLADKLAHVFTFRFVRVHFISASSSVFPVKLYFLMPVYPIVLNQQRVPSLDRNVSINVITPCAPSNL